METPLAACCLIERQGRILAVSRGRNPFNWGLPGGSVEPSEPVEHAAARELREETGVALGPQASLRQLAEGPSFTHYVHIFGVEGELMFPDTMCSIPFEGYVAWLKPQDMVLPTCRFADFQHELFTKLGIL